ncbi:alpha/beta fold hydrolase [Bacillus sp. AK128]
MHAMGTDHRSMKWIESIFKTVRGFMRIYIDLPAHGKSIISDDLRTSDDILTNILEFIDQVIPNQLFSLIGSSYGGYLAQGILHHRSEKVKSICLLAPALHLRKRNIPEKVILAKDEEIVNELSPGIRTAFETLMINQTRENLTIFLNEIQPGRLLANREFLMSNWRDEGYFFKFELFKKAVEFSQPALIILGKQDSICGYKDHYFLLDKFPNGTLTVLNQAGHMLYIDKREVVEILIKDWLIRTNEAKSD